MEVRNSQDENWLKPWHGRALPRAGFHALAYFSVVGAMIVAVVFVERAELRSLQVQQRAKVNEFVDQLSRNLAAALTRKAVAASGLAQTVSLLPEISQEQFSSISGKIASSDPSIVVTSLVRDWQISHVYPLEENQSILGADLRDSVARVDAINRARDRGAGLVQGPIRLLVGTDGFIVRQPIFLPAALGEHAIAEPSVEFWGLVSVVFAAEPFFAEVGVADIDPGYEVAIRRSSDTGHAAVFGDTTLFDMEPARREVVFPLGAWDIAVSPSGSWMSSLPNPWPLRVAALLGAIILLILLRELLRLRASQKRDARSLKAAIDTMPDGFVLYDSDDRLVVCNEKYKEFYRKSAAAMKPGNSFKSILEYGLSQGQYAEALGREQEWLEERLERHRNDEAFVEQELDDGRWLRIIERAAPDGSRAGLRVDITELKKNEKKLEILLNRNPAIVMSQGRDWRIQTCSDAWTQQFGYNRGETVGRDLTEFMPAEDAEESRIFREAHLKSGDARQIIKNILTLKTKSGEARSVELQSIIEDENGEWLNLIAMTDITPIVRARDELERLVENDELTGLMSRRGLQRRFADGQRRRDAGFFLIDLDYFKSVNDGYGHEAGDGLLKAIAGSLKTLTATAGCPIRLGGEEFAIVRPWSGWQEAANFAEELRKTLSDTSVLFQGRLIQRSASIGYIEVKAQDELSTAMHFADLAQREAKSTGRNKCVPADANMLRSLEERGAFITNEDVQAALEAGEFFYQVQPIVHAGSERIAGFEALIRWHKSDGEIIMPDRFIETLYEVLRQPYFGGIKDKLRTDVVEKLAEFEGRYIGFNFILEDIAYPGAAEKIDSIFGETISKAKQRILVEISERSFHSRVDTELLVGELQKLRERGYLIALDDFGVESSNIQRLQQFPIDVVKLDKSLIRDLVVSDRQRTTVISIARMIENLGLTCIVEGVETEQQARMLQEMGLVVHQGFFHARPVSPKEVAASQIGTCRKQQTSKNAEIPKRIPSAIGGKSATHRNARSETILPTLHKSANRNSRKAKGATFDS